MQSAHSPPTLLTLPLEIRAKIYAHLLPTSIVLAISSRYSLSDSTDSSAPKSPESSELMHTSPALTAAPLTYTACDYRYAGKMKFDTNATRPALRELAMTCRFTHTELMPQIVACLHPRCESIAAACVFAARLGSPLAAEVREVTVQKPLSSCVVGTTGWFPDGMFLESGRDGEEGAGRDAAADAVVAWMGLMARLLPGLQTLRLYEMPMSTEVHSLVDGRPPEGSLLELSVQDGVRQGWPDMVHMTKSLVPGTRSTVVVWRSAAPVWERKGIEGKMRP